MLHSCFGSVIRWIGNIDVPIPAQYACKYFFDKHIFTGHLKHYFIVKQGLLATVSTIKN